MVLGGALAGILPLSFAGLVTFRYLGPEFGFRNAAFALGTLIALGTAMLGWLLARLLLRPIHALERFAAQVQHGDAAPPPLHFGTTELHQTVQSVIDMARTLQNREATIRSYTDHMTHEVKTPVAVIRAAVVLLEDAALTPSDRKLVAQIDGARIQIEAQLQALRRAARAREVLHIGACTLSDLASRPDHPGLTLVLSGARMPIPFAAEALLIPLSHLLRNPAEHGAQRVEIAAGGNDSAIAVTFSDDGSGVSGGNASRIFDPFFTTKRATGGTGMGLSIARNLIEVHRWRIVLIPSAKGAAFLLTFGVQ